MVRQATYDYRGHRIKGSAGSTKLPPISNEGSRHGSASSNSGKKSADPTDENYKKLGDEIIGVLYAVSKIVFYRYLIFFSFNH